MTVTGLLVGFSVLRETTGASGAVLSIHVTLPFVMSLMLPAASVERNQMAPLSDSLTPPLYSAQPAPSFVEYSLRTESAANVAVTVTGPSVAAVVL